MDCFIVVICGKTYIMLKELFELKNLVDNDIKAWYEQYQAPRMNTSFCVTGFIEIDKFSKLQSLVSTLIREATEQQDELLQLHRELRDRDY